MKRIAIAAIAATLLAFPASAEPPAYHMAPVENLERVDVDLLSRARNTIDMAAYVLTDWAIMDALEDAARRGVAVRLVLDGSQFQPRNYGARMLALAKTDNIAIRIKPSGRTRGHRGFAPIMHLKAYLVDGATLRTGSANFSASGEKKQDNDLVVLTDKPACDAFARRFEEIWDAAREAER